MMHPALSIIVPTYNTELYIERCLDSLINQSFSDIEIIIIDDDSTDNTKVRVSKYLDDPRVTYHKFDKNKGVGAARNLGVKLAKGEFVIFCDSDDWVDIYLYENMYEVLQRTKADISICGTLKEFGYGKEPVVKANFEKEILIDGRTALKILTLEYDFGITITASANNKMLRRDFLIKNNIDFLEGYQYEDIVYSFETLFHSQNVVCIPRYYYHYYRRENSVIMSVSKHHIESFYMVFKKIRDFLQEKEIFNDYAFNYYRYGERFYNLIIRQIFEYEKNDLKKKELVEYSVGFIKKLISMKEFIRYTSAEKLRNHIQPYLSDTRII